jgi:hypothetical protein
VYFAVWSIDAREVGNLVSENSSGTLMSGLTRTQS